MTRTDPTDSRSDSPPWSATASVLLAFLALAVYEDAFTRDTTNSPLAVIAALAPIVLSAVAILLSRLIRFRLERGQPAVWMVRLVAYAALAWTAYAASAADRIQSLYFLNFMTFLSRLFGVCFVAECVIQHWQRPPRGQLRGAVLVFLAAIVFVLASRTFVSSYVKFLTPPFIILLALSMRASRARVERWGERVHPWLGAIFLATLLGGTGALAIAVHNAELRRIIESIFKPTSYSDFSDINARPQLGRSFNQPLSQRRVMRIEGTLSERHMRGMAFETYVSNGAWGPSMESRGTEDAGTELKAHPGGQRLTVTPLIENLNVLFVPLHMEGVDAKAYHLTWARAWGGPIYASSSLNVMPPYEIAVVNDTFKGPLCLAAGDKVRERCLDTTDIDPRVVALAKQIAPMEASTEDKIEAVRKYLWRNHSYSLTIDLGPGDPVANFLLQKRDGHCQYFASSAVLLLRCLGVPARYVTGYYAHESPEPDVTVVRQRDAHAWVETWSDGEGWTTFDPTPSGGMPGQSGGVSFWSREWEKLGDWAEAFGAWLRESPATKLTLLLGIVIVLGIVIHWLRVWRAAVRQAIPRITYAGPGHEFDVLAKKFDDWLKRNGTPCPPQRPWRDHLDLLQAGAAKRKEPIKIDWDDADAFARDYSAARFGGNGTHETLQKLNAQLTALVAGKG